MSERDLRRVEVLGEVTSGWRTAASAATALGLSPRQVYRLLRRYRDRGASGLAHKARGRPSNNRLRDEIRDQALALVRSTYADFGPTHGAAHLDGAARSAPACPRPRLRTVGHPQADPHAGLPMTGHAAVPE